MNLAFLFERLIHDRNLLPRRIWSAFRIPALYKRILTILREREAVSIFNHGPRNLIIHSMLKSVEREPTKYTASAALEEIEFALAREEGDAHPQDYLAAIRALRRAGRIQEAESFLLHVRGMPQPARRSAAETLLRTICRERGAISLEKRKADFNGYISSIRKYAATRKTQPKSTAVVTAIIGNYDNVLLPEFIENDIDYIIFSDHSIPSYGIFDVRPLPWSNKDPTRSARYIKTHLLQLLPEYDTVVWLDGNIMSLQPIQHLSQRISPSSTGLLTLLHPFRTSPYEEMQACIADGKDDVPTIQRQRAYYRSLGYNSTKLIESNIFVINTTAPRVAKFCHAWWEQITHFSRRDQLSMNYCLDTSGVRWAAMNPRGISARNHPDFVIFQHGELPEGYSQFIQRVEQEINENPDSTNAADQ